MLLKLNFVACPNCSHPTEYNPENGLSCPICFIKLSVEEYITKSLNANFDFGDEIVKTKVKKGGLILGEFFLGSDNTICLELYSQATLLPLVTFAASLPNKLSVTIAGDEPYSSRCLVCGSSLRYEKYPFSDPTIGCRGTNHTYYYQHPLHWISSILGHIYPDWQFISNISDDTVTICRIKPVPTSNQTFREWFFGVEKKGGIDIEHLPEKISFGSNGESIAFSIPRTLQEKVGNIYGTINSLRVANLNAVLTND